MRFDNIDMRITFVLTIPTEDVAVRGGGDVGSVPAVQAGDVAADIRERLGGVRLQPQLAQLGHAPGLLPCVQCSSKRILINCIHCKSACSNLFSCPLLLMTI